MLGIANLYRTGVAAADPTFLPSCVDRADYQKQAGHQPPSHDPTQADKFWWDPSAAALPPTQNVTYQAWNGDLVNPALIPLTVPAAVAAAVNVPGVQTYVPYVIQPTTTTWAGGNIMPAEYLSLPSDADALVALSPMLKWVDGDAYYSGNVLMQPVYPPGEARRLCVILGGSQPYFAGEVLKQRNAMGVGYPGAWDPTNLSKGILVWVPAVYADGPSRPSMPIPCNPVPTGMFLTSVINGLIPTVEILPNPAPPVVNNSSGGDTLLAQDTNDKVTKILKMLVPNG